MANVLFYTKFSASGGGLVDGSYGEITISGSGTVMTIDKTAITGKTAVTAVGTDYVLISDTSDSGNLKKALVSDFGGSGLTQQQVEGLI